MLTKYKTWLVVIAVGAAAYAVGGLDMLALCVFFAGIYWWLVNE